MNKALAVIVLLLLTVPVESGGPVDTVYLLEQDADRRSHPEFVTLITDARVRKELEARGLTYRLFDRESADPTVQWGDDSLPVVQLLSDNNIILTAPASMLTFSELIALVEAHQ